ncbi:hypothetical protein WG904_01645 [Pedobacter sp. Du54]|uniref:hypothetical protein n=1 Tax=Pedobacter anseongensis TaxID=3133439 RepID=UPI0030B7C078
MGKQQNDKETPKQTGNAKGKASFDQNGEGNSPKYAQSGEEPTENGALEDQAFNKDKSKKEE